MTNLEEEIIKCAVGGGYDIGYNFTFVKNSSSHIRLFICDSKKSFVLDPNFWEAIGRAKGWENGEEYNGSNYETSYQGECKTNALRFHEINLTQGWQPAIEYLYSLTKTQSY